MAKSKKKSIFKWFVLAAYIGCAATIIVESCIPGASSASQSDAVGGSLSDLINDISKDQTKYVALEKIQISYKITSATIGETYQIETIISPTNATNQSLTYTSSDINIAQVSETGLITFKNKGEVTITAQSAFDESKMDQMTISVLEVLPTKMTVTIKNAIYNEQKQAYLLYIGQDYPISVNMSPHNVTDNSFYVQTSYTNSAIEIQNNIILAKYYNNLELIPIEIIANADSSIKETIYVYVDYSQVVEPLSLSFLESDLQELYVGQTKKMTVVFEPENVSFSNLTYESLTPSIATFDNGIIKAVSPGNATILARSVRNPAIYVTHSFKVLPLPVLEDLLVTNTLTVVVGSSKKISLTKRPSNAVMDNELLSFSSENESIAQVNQQGVVYGCSYGTTTITITYNQQIKKEVTIQVIEKENVSITAIEVTLKQSILTVNQTISNFLELSYLPKNATVLSDRFEFIPLNYYDLTSEELAEFSQYNLNELDTLDLLEYDPIENKITTFNKEGIAFFKIYHLSSGLTSKLMHVKIQEILPTEIRLYHNDEELVQIAHYQADQSAIEICAQLEQEEQATFKEINWKIEEIEGEDVALLELTGQKNSRILTFVNEGIIDLTVSICTPFLETKIEKTIRFYITHEDLSLFQITDLTDSLNPNIIVDNYNLYKNQTVPLGIYTNQKYTRLFLKWSSSNSKVASVSSDGLLKTKECGITTIQATNLYNGSIASFQLHVYNFLSLDKDNTYTLCGNTLKHIKDNQYQITNGNSITLTVHYDPKATYTSVSFSSSNESVATIGKDGIITPHQVGTTTITVSYTDNYSVETPLEFSIQLKIIKKPLITDIQSFTSFIRKALGHFGVFFILGIFSLLTYFIFFKKRQWFYSIPIHFASGYLVAVLSEFIQLYVPGRSGLHKDVMIDYSGFLLSSALVLLIYILTISIRYGIRKRKAKKEVQTP